MWYDLSRSIVHLEKNPSFYAGHFPKVLCYKDASKFSLISQRDTLGRRAFQAQKRVSLKRLVAEEKKPTCWSFQTSDSANFDLASDLKPPETLSHVYSYVYSWVENC